MSSFINQTNLSKENPNNHHPNMIMKQKSTLKGKKSSGLKVRKPLGQINANVGTTLKHNHSKNSGIKKQQKTFRKPLGTISKNSINVNKSTVPNVEAWPKSNTKHVEYFPYAEKPSAKTFLNNLTKCNNNNNNNKNRKVVEIDHEETKHLITSGFDNDVDDLVGTKSLVVNSSKKGGLLGSLIGDMGDEDLSDLSSSDDDSSSDDE